MFLSIWHKDWAFLLVTAEIGLPLAINLLLVSKEFFIHHGCQYTTVKGWWSYPPVTAFGKTTPTLVERGWRWKTMITCTTCYRCTIMWQRERLYCFFVRSASCYTNICTVKLVPSPRALRPFSSPQNNLNLNFKLRTVFFVEINTFFVSKPKIRKHTLM